MAIQEWLFLTGDIPGLSNGEKWEGKYCVPINMSKTILQGRVTLGLCVSGVVLGWEWRGGNLNPQGPVILELA